VGEALDELEGGIESNMEVLDEDERVAIMLSLKMRLLLLRWWLPF
jgi:hypothetical protein